MQRTHEIGIRTALGAHPRSIVSTIVRRAAIQLSLGVGLGTAFSTYVFVVLAQNPAVKSENLGLVVAGVAGTALVGTIACTVPTLRGLRIKPTEALREG